MDSKLIVQTQTFSARQRRFESVPPMERNLKRRWNALQTLCMYCEATSLDRLQEQLDSYLIYGCAALSAVVSAAVVAARLTAQADMVDKNDGGDMQVVFADNDVTNSTLRSRRASKSRLGVLSDSLCSRDELRAYSAT